VSLIGHLKEDHRITINEAWPVVDTACSQIREGKEVSPKALAAIVTFLNGFVLEHHVPREDALLDLARHYGIEQENPLIDKIIMEHEEAKNYIVNLSEVLQGTTQEDRAAREEFADDSIEFITFLVRHETEETEDLFPLIERVLSETDRQDMLAGFAAVEEEESEDSHGRFQRLLTEIKLSL
jgi:hemerythrin-like domain-containing protein